MDSPKAKPAPATYTTRRDYLDSMRKRAEEANGTYNTMPSQAWLQDQEEKARRQTSSAAAPMNDDDDNFKPIPIVKKAPDVVKAPPTGNKPLKSAMKKPTKKQE